MVLPEMTCQTVLTYSTSYSLPRPVPFCLGKAHGNSRHWKGLEHSLFGWMFPGATIMELLWNIPQWPWASQTYRQEGWCVQPAAFAAGAVCSPEGQTKTFQPGDIGLGLCSTDSSENCCTRLTDQAVISVGADDMKDCGGH